MTMENGKLIEVLNDLIATCTDGAKGYQTASDCVGNHELKTLFHSYAHQRERFATELQQEVEKIGGQAGQRGSMTGALRRGWTNLKKMVTGGNDKGIVSECEQGEDEAKKRYEEALKESLPAELQAIVQRQFTSVKEAHDRIRALETAVEKLG